MRFCVFFTVLLLKPALSLSAGNITTTTVTPAATTKPSSGNITTTTVTPAATTKPSSGNTTTATVTPTANSITNATVGTTDTTVSSPATTATPTEGTTSVTPTASSITNASEGNITTTTVTPAATTKPSSGNTTTATVTPTANSITNATVGTTDTTVSSPATTATPTEGTTSVTPTASSITNASEGNITTTTVTPAATTKPSSDPCDRNPCGTNSAKCISLHSDHVCQCPYGFYYDNSTCYPGKIFPGTIILAGTYPKDIETVNSSLYQQMSENLTAFFEEAFNLTDYKQTVIVKVDVTTGNTRSDNFGVNVTVMNIFEKNTKETTKTVSEKITNKTQSGYLKSYSSTSHCAVFDCDNATTECQEREYPECKCKNGLSKTAWDDRSCSDCSSDCSANYNKYCAKADGVPRCYCMTNFKEEGEKCVSCPVGYSGQNCENNFELILIIVGTVSGAIILCLVVAVSIVSVRAKYSKDPEKKSLIKPRHSNPDTSSETRIFPRVQTTSGHANPGYQPNPYEAHSSNRNHFLDGDYDDVYDMSREPEGFRMQRR